MEVMKMLWKKGTETPNDFAPPRIQTRAYQCKYQKNYKPDIRYASSPLPIWQKFWTNKECFQFLWYQFKLWIKVKEAILLNQLSTWYLLAVVLI